MARYTCAYLVKLPVARLKPALEVLFQKCDLDLMYETTEYIMAREKTGQVPFAKLVNVEVLIDKTKATAQEVRVDLVIKNEELPLQIDNHCHQLFVCLQKTIAQDETWVSLETSSLE